MALGIDFGTSFTAAATIRDGSPRLVELDYDRTVIPSTLFMKADGELIVGADAELAGAALPERLLLNMKLDIPAGQDYVICGQRIALAKILAAIFEFVRHRARSQHPQLRDDSPVTLTVPASYLEADPDCIVYREAAKLAGFDLNSIAFLAEPAGAAIGYLAGGWEWPAAEDQAVLVYDLGGGTFDAAAIRWSSLQPVPVGVPVGDQGIGGARFDRKVLDAVIAQASPETRELYRRPEDPAALAEWHARVTQAMQICRGAKERLAVLGEARLPLPGFSPPVPVLSAAALDALLTPMIEATAAYLSGLVGELRQMEIEPVAILLVGGSCRLAVVPEVLSRMLDLRLIHAPDPARIVAIGAAVDAARRDRHLATPELSRVAGMRDDPAAAFRGRAGRP